MREMRRARRAAILLFNRSVHSARQSRGVRPLSCTDPFYAPVFFYPQTKTVDMQFEYDPEQLILEVSKRPALWDTENAGYRAKHLKTKLWADVVKKLVSINDISLSKSEIIELEIQLQKKWKSLRDYHKKYLANPKKFKRPYIFAKHLQFLLKDNQWPVERKKKPTTTLPANESDEGNSQRESLRNVWVPKKKIRIQNVEAESDDNDTYDNGDFQDDYQESPANDTETTAPVSGQYAFANVDVVKNDNDDTDKMFLMSLLPHLRSIPEEFRLNVKLELMQVLRVANESTAKFKYSNSLG